jgi:hypothetical protein
VTKMDISEHEIGASGCAHIDKLLARNDRLRHLFLFDARKMLLSVLCADECGVLWPYGDDKTCGIKAPAHIETLRGEFPAVVEERRRRELCGPVLVADSRVLRREESSADTDERDKRAIKRRRTGR